MEAKDLEIVRIRDFSDDVFESYRNLAKSPNDTDYAEISEEGFKENLSEKHIFLLMARKRNELEWIGTASLFIINSAEPMALLADVAVDKRFRCQKIGSLLCKEAQRIAFNNNVINMMASVTTNNSAAYHMLRNVGFESDMNEQKLTYIV